MNQKRCCLFGRWTMNREIPVLVLLVLFSLGLFLIPAPEVLQPQEGDTVRARVLEVDNQDLLQHGLIRTGTQSMKVKILAGEYRGNIFSASNVVRGQLELDKFFERGDMVRVNLLPEEGGVGSVLTVRDYDRSVWGGILMALFCVLLCWFGGWTGLKALFSFLFSCLLIWKALVPLVLQGWPASWLIFACVCFLTAVIVFLIAGFTKKGAASFLGSISGVLAGLVMAHVFTRLLNINGAVLPYSQTLLYSGYEFLNLQDIFIGAMMLASSGAVMDLSMDIASGVEEVHRHSPGLSAKVLMASGMRMGRSVVGTMTTTLLLAYSGGYVTLLMVFCAQGTSPWEFINNPLVASEAVKTLIGSFSLVLVAPFTAVAAGMIFGTGKGETNLPSSSGK